MGRARASLEEATRLLRAAVSALHPVTLSHGGLVVAVESVAREHAARGGFKVDVRADPPSSTVHDQFVLVAIGELLANVVKHAAASKVEVAVRETGAELIVEVADDGPGFDLVALAAVVADGHVGLASLIERAEIVGGRLEVLRPADGGGSRVRLALPLD